LSFNKLKDVVVVEVVDGTEIEKITQLHPDHVIPFDFSNFSSLKSE